MGLTFIPEHGVIDSFNILMAEFQGDMQHWPDRLGLAMHMHCRNHISVIGGVVQDMFCPSLSPILGNVVERFPKRVHSDRDTIA